MKSLLDVRCPEPGCPLTLEADHDSPNVLRCSMHGPMLEIREAYLVPTLDVEA